MGEMHLPHAHDDCTGEWKRVGTCGASLWHCSVCAMEHPSTPENDRAAVIEYVAGVQLRSQTRQGRFRDLLQRPPSPPGPVIELPDPDDEEGDWS